MAHAKNSKQFQSIKCCTCSDANMVMVMPACMLSISALNDAHGPYHINVCAFR